jgi:hypothetical protein
MRGSCFGVFIAEFSEAGSSRCFGASKCQTEMCPKRKTSDMHAMAGATDLAKDALELKKTAESERMGCRERLSRDRFERTVETLSTCRRLCALNRARRSWLWLLCSCGESHGFLLLLFEQVHVDVAMVLKPRRVDCGAERSYQALPAVADPDIRKSKP